MRNIQYFSKSNSLILLVLFLVNSATADQRTDTGFYLSGGIGRSYVDSDLHLEEDTGTIPRIAAGWQVTPLFGIEAGYQNFNENKDPIATLSQHDISGLSFAGTFHLPVSSKLAIFAKIGQIWWTTDLSDTSCSRGPAGCSTTVFDVSEADIFLGLGIGFELTDRFELEVEYDYFEFEFGRTLDIFNSETSVIALSLRYEF